MKASTQYNDLIGTAASDYSDQNSAESILEKYKIDTERFHIIGFEFFSGTNNYFNSAVICRDKQESTEDKDFIVKIQFGSKLSMNDFFSLFKRFHVVIKGKKGESNFEEIDEYIDIAGN